MNVVSLFQCQDETACRLARCVSCGERGPADRKTQSPAAMTAAEGQRERNAVRRRVAHGQAWVESLYFSCSFTGSTFFLARLRIHRLIISTKTENAIAA